MSNRREWRSVTLVLGLMAIAAVVTIASCGGGGGSDSNGGLCEQCGDTDGPCNVAGADVTADQTQPSFCPNRNQTGQPAGATDCHAALVCTRKVDSSQRRCFPGDPDIKGNPLDLRYECDGSRPGGTPVTTATPTTTPTPTTSSTPTPTTTSTAPTPTGVTPSPSATATPAAQAKNLDVTIPLTTNADHVTATFTVTVTYPPAAGTFGGAGAHCEDDGGDALQSNDNGSGTIVVSVPADADNPFESIDVICTFHQLAGQTLTAGDVNAHPSNGEVTLDGDITVEDATT